MPRPREPKPPKRRHALLFGLLACLIAGVGAGLATGKLTFSSAIALSPEILGAPPTEPEPRPSKATPKRLPVLDRPMTLLLMGTDAKGKHGRASLDGNTDTMLLLRLDPGESRIRVVSIPRDTRTPIPGHGIFKINAANAWGGPELAVRTVSRLLGVEVDRYFLVSLQGLIAAVDALGGVEAEVPKRLVYRDRAGGLAINLKPGRQHLDGRDVEALLRFRHDDQGDLGRVQRQQRFLMELMPQILQPAHLLRLPILLGILRNNAETDLSPYEMLQLAGWLRMLDAEADVQLTVLPGTSGMIAGGWYWLANPRAIDSFLVSHFGKEPSAHAPLGPPSITVARPEGLTHEAWKAAVSELEAAGYLVRQDPPRRMEARTRVIAQRGDPEGAQRLVETLGAGRIVVAGVGDMRSDFTLHLGSDLIQSLVPPPG